MAAGGAAEDGRSHQVTLELLHLCNAVNRRCERGCAVAAHDAGGELRVDRVEHVLRLHDLPLHEGLAHSLRQRLEHVVHRVEPVQGGAPTCNQQTCLDALERCGVWVPCRRARSLLVWGSSPVWRTRPAAGSTAAAVARPDATRRPWRRTPPSPRRSPACRSTTRPRLGNPPCPRARAAPRPRSNSNFGVILQRLAALFAEGSHRFWLHQRAGGVPTRHH
eukprot:scaffold23657_cov45-Phaeocystis_antarctica.AAC.2